MNTFICELDLQKNVRTDSLRFASSLEKKLKKARKQFKMIFEA